MEHRLILGGEQYLGVARGIVAKLKKIGLPYASQVMELGDASIKVRIEPGHEYIRIDGGGGKLAMDSGVVDLINVGANSPHRFDAGVLYPSTSMGGYVSGFSTVVNGGKINPGKSSAGQLLGTVSVAKPKLRGKLHDKAYSFYPMLKETAKDSNQWLPAEDDAAVWAKKFVANACPASMFTGKCRLYVQAMYGRPIYKRGSIDDAGAETGPTTGSPDLPMFDGNARPGLLLRNLKGDGEVSIWTSSGVHLDVATGRHFLMNPSGNKLEVYPLISTKTGEDLRKYITPGATEYAELDADDRERAEAYVLAYSRPDADKLVTVTGVGNGAINAWSMGYGWHWNWSGTTATLTSFEIVVDETYGNSGTVGATIFNESSRYSLNVGITVAEDKTFEVTAAVTPDEIKKPWYVSRGYAGIAEPDWQSKGLTKSTDRYNRWLDGDAPYYSFYRRDELQVARVKVELTRTPPAPTRVCSPPDFAPAVGQLSNGYKTFGSGGGTFTDTSPVTTKLNVSFSCSGVTVSFENSACSVMTLKHSEKIKGSLSDGSPIEPVALGWNDDGVRGPDGSWLVMPTRFWSADSGVRHDDGTYDQAHIQYPSGMPIEYGCGYYWTIPEEVRQTDVIKSGVISSVIPLFDAEAILLHGKQRIETGEHVHYTRTLTGRGGYFGGTKYAGGVINWEGSSVSGLAGGGTPPVNIPLVNEVAEPEVASLCCSAGSLPARADLMRLTLADNGDDSVPIGVNVFTSAGVAPVVVSGLLVVPHNTLKTGELLAMVGWA